MRRLIRQRYDSWKEIFWRKAVGLIAAAYFLLGLWDLFKSEFLPEQYQSLTIVKVTPHLSWRTWVIGMLAISILVPLEGAHAAIQKRNNAIEQLTIASTNNDRPKNVLRRDWNGDWKDLANEFKGYAAFSLRADWHHTSAGEGWYVSGTDTRIKHGVEVLCRNAGRLLIASPRVSETIPGNIRSLADPMERWFYYLKTKGTFYKANFYGTEQFKDGTVFNAYGGAIESLATASANECLDCAGQEF
jgi:hypothetical protein